MELGMDLTCRFHANTRDGLCFDRMNGVLAELIKRFCSGAMKSSYHQLCFCQHWTENPEATWKRAITSVFLNIRKERKVNVDSFNQHLRTHYETQNLSKVLF